MFQWKVYVDLVVAGTSVYDNLAKIVRVAHRRPAHVSEFTWMSDINNRSNSHLADRRIFWMYRPFTHLMENIFRSNMQNNSIICATPPAVYGVAERSMTQEHASSIYSVMVGFLMIREVMVHPLTLRNQTEYLDHALNQLYAGLRTMPLDRFGVGGLHENQITTRDGGGDFNLRLAIETNGIDSPFGKCMQLWAYELNFALQHCWSYRSIATSIIEPFLYTMLVPPNQPPLHGPNDWRNFRR